MADLVKQFGYKGPIGVGFPAVVIQGIVITPPTALAFPNWVDVNLVERARKAAEKVLEMDPTLELPPHAGLASLVERFRRRAGEPN